MNNNVVITSDGHAAIFGPLLRNLFLIYEHYKSRGERVMGVTDLFAPRHASAYEIDLLSSDWKNFTTKVRVTDNAIVEYAREALSD